MRKSQKKKKKNQKLLKIVSILENANITTEWLSS